jgi:hypothetical protein
MSIRNRLSKLERRFRSEPDSGHFGGRLLATLTDEELDAAIADLSAKLAPHLGLTPEQLIAMPLDEVHTLLGNEER